MATVTAYALIGQAHRNHGGINPTHRLYLSENSRPAWMLLPENVQTDPAESGASSVTWIPTLEGMLEDALLMVGLHVLQDPALMELANRTFREPLSHFVELYQDISTDDLDQMRSRNRSTAARYKLALTVLPDSHIQSQLGALADYTMDVDVCVPKFSRSYSEWNRATSVQGTLD